MAMVQEPQGTLSRTIFLTIRPTATEIADAIWNLDTSEQIVLLGCLKRRFCDKETGLLQMASVANVLNRESTEKHDEAKAFVKCLARYILEE